MLGRWDGYGLLLAMMATRALDVGSTFYWHPDLEGEGNLAVRQIGLGHAYLVVAQVAVGALAWWAVRASRRAWPQPPAGLLRGEHFAYTYWGDVRPVRSVLTARRLGRHWLWWATRFGLFYTAAISVLVVAMNWLVRDGLAPWLTAIGDEPWGLYAILALPAPLLVDAWSRFEYRLYCRATGTVAVAKPRQATASAPGRPG